ncbi:MAG: hypothetical protein ACP5O1_00075 [Phycisphaerae bacterium]
MSNIRIRIPIVCALFAASAVSAPIFAAVSAGNLPPAEGGRAVMVMRIANPRLFRSNIQWMAEHIFIPGVIPSVKAMEMQIDIPGGIHNSKPMELLLMPTGVESGALEPVLIFSASNPALAVSKLNPPAPVNGISMVVLNNGTSGYVALKKHAVLFASHREALRMVLHHPGAAIPALTGRAKAMFTNSDVSVYLNIRRLLQVEGPRIRSAISKMNSALKAEPMGETAKQKLGFHVIGAMTKLIAKRYRSMVGGIRVNKKGITVEGIADVRVRGTAGAFLEALSESRLLPARQMPDLPLAMALRLKLPYTLSTSRIAEAFKHVFPRNATKTPPAMADIDKILELQAKHPDGKYLRQNFFLIAPVKMQAPLLATVEDFNVNDPQAICHLAFKAVLDQTASKTAPQTGPVMYKMITVREAPMTVDGITFNRVALHASLTPGVQKLGISGEAFAKVFRDGIDAEFGGPTSQFAVGYLGHRVIEANNLRPSQLKKYIEYLKGHGISATKIAGAAAPSHYLPGAFIAGFFDPAVELGQLTADVSADSGMMQIPNPVQAGRTPVWALSASCLRNKPEIKLFMPTASLRVSSQQLHRILAGAMMIFMQIQHPASGA